MIATNHALTGAVIGLTVSNPVLAMVLAVFSHFVCDIIPHFGLDKNFIKSKKFRYMLLVDALLCITLVLVLSDFAGNRWIMASLCAFLAAAPDFASINRFRHAVRGTYWEPNWFTKFASGIQWFERPVGAIVEATWFIAGVILLTILL